MNHVGLNKDVEIFATPGGKWSGYIWPHIQTRYQIDWHLGDNQGSDVDSPNRCGIKGVWFGGSEHTEMENMFRDGKHDEIASLMRVLRLMNPYPLDSLPYRVWNEQSQMNMPILIMASLYLNNYCKEHHKNRILFAARDCVHFIEVFKKLFPEYESIYFHSSRLAYEDPSSHYVEYVKKLYSSPNTVIVDGFGTGLSCERFFTKHFDMMPCIIQVVNAWDGPGMSNGVDRNGYKTGIFDNFEKINYAAEGSLMDYDEKGPVLLPIEYDVEHLKPAYACREKCLELLHRYQYGDFDQSLFDKVLITLQNQGYVLSEVIKHCSEHARISTQKI